jgi:prophage antirepressor-like protein
MENNLTVLNSKEFGEVRAIEIEGKIYFGATDSAKALGYINPSKAISDHCKKDGITNREVIDSLGRNQQMNFITEGNLYRLISKSKLPTAEKFESWIFDEVLPDIRKNGMYATDVTLDNMLNNPDFAINLLVKYKEEKEAKLRLQVENKEKDELLKIAAEKTSLLDDFLGKDSLHSIDSVSKIFAIKALGRNNFYKYLRENSIIMTDTYIDKQGKEKSGSKHFTAYAQYTNSNEYFKHRQREVCFGQKTIMQDVAMFTGKGISWIYKKLQKDGYIHSKGLEEIIKELKELKEAA